MAGANISGFGNKKSDAVNSSNQTFNRKSFALKPCIDYFITPKIGAGISYNNFEYQLHAENYIGSEYDPGWFFFFYMGPDYIDFYDIVEIKTSGNMFTAHAAYKLAQYNREKRQLFEITAHGGISVSFINEEQHLTVTRQTENPDGSDHFYQQTTVFYFNKTAGSVFLNLQVALHATKYFSFILADLTKNFGIMNPTIPQTSATINESRTLTIKEHKLSPSGFVIATGLAVSF